jgi:hypothetical protein
MRACNWVEGSVTLASRNRVIDTSTNKRKMCDITHLKSKEIRVELVIRLHRDRASE